MPRTIILKCQHNSQPDGCAIEISTKAARLSGLLRSVLDNHFHINVIHLPVYGPALRAVAVWCMIHEDDNPSPEDYDDDIDVIPIDDAELFEICPPKYIILVARFLRCPALVMLCEKAIEFEEKYS